MSSSRHTADRPTSAAEAAASTINVWAFGSADTATVALRLVERAQRRGDLAVADCAVVEWPQQCRRPVAYQVGAADGSAALSGAFWGLLFSTLFLAPLAGLSGPIWPPDGLSRIGLPEPVLERIRGHTRPGTSELFVLSDGPDADGLAHALAGVESHCTTARLTAEQNASLRRAFGREEAIEPQP